MAKRKTKIQQKREKFQLFIFVVNAFVCLFVFFNLALLMNGSWDDIKLGYVALLPILTLFSLGAAVVNVLKNKSKGRELLASMATFACAGALSVAVMIYPVIVALGE